MSSSESLEMAAKLQSYCWLPYSFNRYTYILCCIFLFHADYSKEKASFSIKNKSWVRLSSFPVLSHIAKWDTTPNPLHNTRFYGLLNDIVRDLDCEGSHFPIRILKHLSFSYLKL